MFVRDEPDDGGAYADYMNDPALGLAPQPEECPEPEPDLLLEYTLAAQALEAFRDQFAGVLVDLERLQTRLSKCESELKAHAREIGPIENEQFTVVVTRPMRRWYDTDLVLERAPYLRELPGVVVTTIDRDKIAALIKAQIVPADVAAAAYREEPLTPAVSIKRKG